ncbi:alpha-(1,3)-fucosyltransferase C-like [Pectinophora gossypiella]|uniref:alpha-(1,3)-fucosyltransferase C-like n=1 Tax=Pectinophora gossypiella TaxID=13191 RepID=UPI00214E28D6|nr:alpha-(1,3)-fucosyltransferase C-like [Pectinophora gossypiella]
MTKSKENSDEMNRKNHTSKTQFSVRKPRCPVNYTGVKYETTEIIYILMWSKRYYRPWQVEKQRIFIENECPYTNCYFTVNRKLFGGDISRFDAVIFESSHFSRKHGKLQMPQVRSPKQKYIFYSMESAHRFPSCDETYDNFFNWTITYRLNSDIVYTYFHIKNSNGEIVGPKRNMEWIVDMENIDKHLEQIIRNKTKAAAWFVSFCSTANDRDDFVSDLQEHLSKYNLTVDIYGKCGPLKCPRSQSDVCNAMLEKDYYFYMALENSFDEDYVTEKILTAWVVHRRPRVLSLRPGRYYVWSDAVPDGVQSVLQMEEILHISQFNETQHL